MDLPFSPQTPAPACACCRTHADRRPGAGGPCLPTGRRALVTAWAAWLVATACLCDWRQAAGGESDAWPSRSAPAGIASEAGPLAALQSPPGGFPVDLPGDGGREVVVPRESALDAGHGERARLLFDARLASLPRSPVRLSFHVQNRQGLYYQTAELAAIPADRWRTIEIDLSPGSDAWEAVGHARPWDELSPRGLVRAGVRLFSVYPYKGALRIRRVRWSGPDAAAGPVLPEVLDLREPDGPVPAGALWELAFRLARPVRDPYDPAAADVTCEIVTPEGAVARLIAFYYQDYRPGAGGPGDDGRPVAVGPPEWRVRYRPARAGRYRYMLMARRAIERSAEPPAAEGWFTVVEGRQSTSPADAAPPAWLEDDDFVIDLSGRSSDAWRPELASLPAELGDDGFRRGGSRNAGMVWRPMLEWTRRWGGWEGMGAYDLELAWRLDRIIEEAEQRGIRMPLALVDDGPFLDHGKYRWPVNPLGREEGGPLAGPGEFYSNAAAERSFLRRARYLIARYGHSPAVSAWCIASGLPASGVAAWHERVGRSLRYLDPAGPDGKPIVSLHPFAVPMSEERDLGEFEEGAEASASAWQHDRADSPGGRVAVAVAASSDGSGALKVFFPGPGFAQPSAPSKHGGPGAVEPPLPPGVAPPWVTVWRPLDEDLFRFDYLTFDVRMPDDARGVGRAQVIVRDRDLLWYEQLIETPLRAGDWTRCVVDLTTAGSMLRGVGHARPWSGYTRSRIMQIGLRIFPNGPVPSGGAALLDHVSIHASAAAARLPVEIRVRERGPEEVGRFEKLEMALDISPEFANPFDPDVVALNAVFRHEQTGREYVMPGFFNEPYARSLVPREVVEDRGGGRELKVVREVETLRVTGGCDWRVRFSPPEVGDYGTRLRVVTPDGTAERAGPSFRCVPSDRRGFVRVASDRRYFEHSSGEVFYPIGPVMRSPSDSRDLDRDPSIRDEVLAAAWRGTYMFDDYLAALAEGGGNWTRMWACSWWCGLEWYRKWPGYGGTGWYNLQNAWRLDHVIETAGRCGIYIQLCLQNHGQTSECIDHEWEYHPYNRYEPEAFIGRDVKDFQLRLYPAARAVVPPNGRRRPGPTGQDTRALPAPDRHDVSGGTEFRRPSGWLEDAAEYFRDARARTTRQKLLRYFVARWGYSPNIFAWVLSSEVEFTGEYQRVQYGADDRDFGNGRWPEGRDNARNTLEWHREMAAYLRRIDPLGHMVTTHFSHPHRGRAIWGSGGLDFVQSNAYGGFSQLGWFHGPTGPRQCVPAPMAMQQYCDTFLARYGRPITIGEWGGHWMGNSIEMLEADLHTGTWASVMTQMAGSTGFWWWLHIHFHGRYQVFGGIGRFLAGEDRRGLGLKPVDVGFLDAATAQQPDAEPSPVLSGLRAVALGNGRQADVYVYHTGQAFALGSAPPVSGVVLVVPGLERIGRGMYVVETWDTTSGKPTGRAAALVVGGRLRFDLPTVRGDLALKVRPLE